MCVERVDVGNGRKVYENGRDTEQGKTDRKCTGNGGEAQIKGDRNIEKKIRQTCTGKDRFGFVSVRRYQVNGTLYCLSTYRLNVLNAELLIFQGLRQ